MSETAVSATGGDCSEVVSITELQNLIRQIEAMPVELHLQVYQILQNDNARYSQNQNGVFVNIARLSSSTLRRITSIVSCAAQRDRAIRSSQASLGTEQQPEPQQPQQPQQPEEQRHNSGDDPAQKGGEAPEAEAEECTDLFLSSVERKVLMMGDGGNPCRKQQLALQSKGCKAVGGSRLRRLVKKAQQPKPGSKDLGTGGGGGGANDDELLEGGCDDE